MYGEADQSVRRQYHAPDTPYDAYHRLHKHFVGPATAEKLVSFYESLSETQKPREMYAAGWAAAEASLVGTAFPIEKRVQLAQAALDGWEYALQLEQERAFASSLLRKTSQNTVEQHRYASTIALAPLVRAIPQGVIPKQTILNCQEQLIRIAEQNVLDMETAQAAGSEGRAASHSGIAYEQVAVLGVNRKKSSRIVGLFALARSGTGFHYPQQTHDIMILNLAKNNIVKTTPTEVKATLKVKVSNRYEAALFGGKKVIGEERSKIGYTVDLFRRELNGDLSADETLYLDSISDSLIHSVRHHHRAKQFGRHCLNISSCTLQQQSQPSVA